MTVLDHVFRPYEISDEGFVYSAWCKAIRREPTYARVESSILYTRLKARIGRLMRQGRTIVACDPDDMTHTYGFVCFDPKPLVLHWVYVKSVYWGMGLGASLFNEAIGDHQGVVICSHASEVAFVKLREAAFRRKVVYDPFALE